ncbi:AlpA family phage regulatory protein [Paradonghicola geojensis]|nr:AlpA family phage regulatory protein [Marivivens geojensis]
MTELERLPSVVQRTTLSRSHLYALMKEGKFPKPIKLGARSVGWRVEDVEAWIATRPQGGSWLETE